MTANHERTVWVAFVTYAVLAGGNAVGIRFSNRELAPLWGAGLRFALAALLLLVVMAVLREPFPRGRALAGSLIYGLPNFGGSFALIYYGLVRVHAGLGQTLLALVHWPHCCSWCSGDRSGWVLSHSRAHFSRSSAWPSCAGSVAGGGAVDVPARPGGRRGVLRAGAGLRPPVPVCTRSPSTPSG